MRGGCSASKHLMAIVHFVQIIENIAIREPQGGITVGKATDLLQGVVWSGGTANAIGAMLLTQVTKGTKTNIQNRVFLQPRQKLRVRPGTIGQVDG